MIPTARSDNIRDLLAFLSRLVGAEAIRARRGANPQDIARFAKLVGFPLPTLYVGYLEEFGQDDRVLQMAADGDPRLTTLIAEYLEAGKVGPSLPPRSVLIATEGLTGGRVLIYPPSTGAGSALSAEAAEPSVGVNWADYVEYTAARTFRNYLYRQAYTRGRFPEGGPFSSMFRRDDRLLPEARQLAVDLGFQVYWFSDDCQVCMDRDDQTALHIQRYKDETTIYLAGNKQVRDDLKRTLIQRLNLTDSSPDIPPIQMAGVARTCPACGKPLREGASFCTACGHSVTPAAPPPSTERQCRNPQCSLYGQPVPPDQRFCTACGTPIL